VRAAKVCDRMGIGIDFARIDLLTIDADSFYLGEVTLYPMAGGHKWKPHDFDLELSRKWCLHSARLEQRF